jgi:hypothetical protein
MSPLSSPSTMARRTKTPRGRIPSLRAPDPTGARRRRRRQGSAKATAASNYLPAQASFERETKRKKLHIIAARASPSNFVAASIDDDDDDGPRLEPSASTNQVRSTVDPSKRRAIGGAPTSFRRNASRPSAAPTRDLAPLRGTTSLTPLPGHRRLPYNRRSALAHTRQSIQKESRRCGDVEVHTSVSGPLRSCCRCLVLSGSPRPTHSVLVVLPSSKRPPRADAVSAESGEYLPTHQRPRSTFSCPDPPTIGSLRLGDLCAVVLRFRAALRRDGNAADGTRRPSHERRLSTSASPADWSRHAGVLHGSYRGSCVAEQGKDSSRRGTSTKRAERPLTSRPTSFDLAVDLRPPGRP